MHRCRLLVLFGSVALVVGALLPWTDWANPSLGASVHILGLDGEGVASGAIGLLLLGMALTKPARPCRHYSLVGTVLASCAGAIAFDGIVDATAAITEALAETPGIAASLGVGLFITLGGALLALGGTLLPVRLTQPA